MKTALLRNDTIRGWDINVDTYENMVVLRGHVENQSEYELAGKIAAGIKGVKTVDSQLQVVGVEIKDRSTSRSPQ